MNLKILLILLLAYTVPNLAFAQQTITGQVLAEENNEPLPGVSIVVKGTTKGTVTDANGNYSITANPEDILVFSYLGYSAEEITVGNQSTINISLLPDLQQLSEVIVTGYQTIKKADLTGAVSVADVEEMNKESVPSLATALQGRIAGLQVTSDGTPGGGNTNLYLRGFATTGENRPLLVIDGVPTMDGLNTLNPNDIESFQILKDAASASVYGARANNGVIVITTKKGKNKLSLSFDSYYSVQRLRNRVDVLNAYEWGQVYFKAQQNAGNNPSHPQYTMTPDGQVVMNSYIDAGKTIPAGNTDWIDESFDPAGMQYYNLSVSNSNDKSSVYFGLGYTKQDGIMKYTNFDRLNARLNTSFNLFNRLTIGENLMISRSNTVAMSDPGFTHQIIFQHPLIPVYDLNGNFGGPTEGLGDKRNPVAALYQNRDNVGKGTRLFGNIYAELKLIKGLSFKTNLGLDYNTFFKKQFDPRWKEGSRSVETNSLTVLYNYSLNPVWTNTLNYQFRNDTHSINAFVGMETNSGYYEDLGGKREEFLLEEADYRYLNAGGTEELTNFNGANDWALLSYFGKLDYSLKDRYLASFTLRRDASSRLDRNNRSGWFPAASIGWRISEESFMQNITPLDELKIRAGYGLTGNQAIGNYGGYTVYIQDLERSRYDFDGNNTNPWSGYKVLSRGNPNVRWETASQYNIGADVAVLRNSLNLTVDYFKKRNEDILLQPQLNAVEGEGNPPFINAGVIENTGWEFDLGYRGNVNDFNFKVGLNVATYKNEVVSLGNDVEFLTGEGPNRIVPGQPVSVFYGYVADGLFKSVEEITNHADQGLPATERSLGRIRYKDLNGDNVINDQDRTYIGDPNPDFIYGINLEAAYKNFDLSLLFDGVQGRDLYNNHKGISDFTYWNFNYGTNTLNAWTPENPSSDIPAVSTTNFNDEFRHSTYFVEDGSYFRLKTIALGYTLPSSLVGKLKINTMRFYVQGQNLFAFSKYSGMDYEVGARGPFNLGFDSQFYPLTKNLTLGVNVSF